MSKSLVEKIKSRGYWRINFRPNRFEAENLSPLSKCAEIVEKSVVSLRGWSYPHFPRVEGTKAGNNYEEGSVDSGEHKELWRMYQSGQFIHYLALKEDWVEESLLYDERMMKIKDALEVTNCVYLLTEIFEFLSRLAKEGLYKDGVNAKIILYNTEGRELKILATNRAPLLGTYRAEIPAIEFSKKYPEKQIVEQSNELALETTVYFFYRFNWKNPPLTVLKNDQQNLLERRF